MGELSRIIKLDATDSTNLYLRALNKSENLPDYSVVVAKKQLKGRGQIGTVWLSEGGKNLTFSILKKFDAFRADQQFILNISVSMALYDVLTSLNIPNVKVKWPNDIMSGVTKICGILIENMLKGNQVDQSIIGIGLNVNQTQFENLDKASSLSSITGQIYDLDELLNMIIGRIKFYTENMEGKTVKQLLPAYENILFRKDKPSTFKDENGEMFPGFIRKVTSTGKLVLELEDHILKEFDLKEVTLLY
ncbi:biotin--[acetyl-CoA-carboxylase] ligase [Flagellimonas zhangzhouensis]|uniref:BirA family transcriptional regulator, biotin operon repressor / biotin-[acetyl-CoA-carboxylase] ligase n=1 Tax=Flagellimonas zhangzhouensis TaxID=1073328 RepID=A0A1H2YY22_9FLAO|nr:biotin--[acetyl-CoA-carboxylase] ligase [Allomuricauda zhangzhouensis]SDR04882.1 BirA family transcriptional regulator, biotin operon repressor / biotin-[acetyl-CoA-carboxylase] ligase [Allomuricauda zhangzhouensis]SDX10063.1 BirA family transcriptional regulator, biotin operon repressor / biotin-[acetyl-CoA-carboxylase] ligase [Allomuricauda zhangzhouensis]